MYKLSVVFFALVAAVSAKPSGLLAPSYGYSPYTAGVPLAHPVAYAVPVPIAPVATSYQHVRNYNGYGVSPWGGLYSYANGYSYVNAHHPHYSSYPYAQKYGYGGAHYPYAQGYGYGGAHYPYAGAYSYANGNSYHYPYARGYAYLG